MANTVTVSAADISLFHVAAAQLADATQWNRIAALNGRTDPWLYDLTIPVVMTLPPVDATQSGGLPL